LKKACEETLYILYKESLCIGRNNIPEFLGQIDLDKNQFDFKTSMDEARDGILEFKQVDLTQISKWIVNPSLQLQSLSLESRRMEDRLPHIERRLYTLEANDIADPSRLVVQFVGRCV
jgi:hypothetical protein